MLERGVAARETFCTDALALAPASRKTEQHWPPRFVEVIGAAIGPLIEAGEVDL